jgi:putative ABC transport system permease protein
MNAVALASRNVRRNGRRSLLTLLALIVGTMGILMFGGYVNDTIQGLQTTTVRTYGHLQVVPRDYLDFGRGNPGRFSIRDYETLLAEIRQDPVLVPMLNVVTPVLEVEGVAGNFALGASSNFVGEGAVPAERTKQLAWDGFSMSIPAAASALREDRPDGGVVGLRMAQLLMLCDALQIADCRRLPADTKSADAIDRPGEADVPADIALAASLARPGNARGAETSIELIAASPGGLPNVVRLNVLKAERQGVRQIDSMYVAMPLGLAQRLVFGPEVRAVSAIVVQLKHTDMLPAAEQRLNQIVAAVQEPLEVVTFHQVSPVYDQIVATYNTIFQFIAALMAVITLFSIANTVNMAVGERVGEIGTLRSLGFPRGTIRRIFVAEGALLGIVGTLVGALAAIMVSEGVINLAGLSWTPPGRTQAIPIHVDILASPLTIAGTVLGLAVVACVSALWPAHKASRLEVTKALSHV